MKKLLVAMLGERGRSLLGRSRQLWLGDPSVSGRHERTSGCPFVDDLGLPSLTHR